MKSEGGSLALVALSSDATVLFNADGLELSLALTAGNERGEERGRATVMFVSSARGFDGVGLDGVDLRRRSWRREWKCLRRRSRA